MALPRLMVPPSSLRHEMEGLGAPLATQRSVTSEPSDTTTSEEESMMSGGSARETIYSHIQHNSFWI